MFWRFQTRSPHGLQFVTRKLISLFLAYFWFSARNIPAWLGSCSVSFFVPLHTPKAPLSTNAAAPRTCYFFHRINRISEEGCFSSCQGTAVGLRASGSIPRQSFVQLLQYSKFSLAIFTLHSLGFSYVTIWVGRRMETGRAFRMLLLGSWPSREGV